MRKYFAFVGAFLMLILCFGNQPAGAATSSATPSFKDLKGHWAESQITRLTALGFVKGYRDLTYKPDQSVTQLEALVLIVQSAGYTPPKARPVKKSTKSKSTVTENTGPKVPWGQPYLDLSIEKGFIPKPDTEGYDYCAPASRLDVARLLARTFMVVPPVNASGFPVAADKDITKSSPKDLNSLAEDDRLLINTLVESDIMNGYPDGLFRPYQAVTRAELATIISRLIDLGWIITPKGTRQVGWISQLTKNKKTTELELTSLTEKKKYKLSNSVQCFNAGAEWPVYRALGYRCEILTISNQVVWISLFEKRTVDPHPEKLRGSVKSVLLGEENLLTINDLSSNNHGFPIAWDAQVTDKKKSSNFKSLKIGTFVDLEVSQGKVENVKVLEVKTLSDTVTRLDGYRLYLKSKTTKSKPGWINYWESSRMIDNNGRPIQSISVDEKIEVTYLDPYPEGIDDEIPLEIKVISRK